MHIIAKKIIPVDELTYKSITTYKCNCGHWEDIENYHVIALKFCENPSCEEVLTEKHIQMKETSKAIEFNIKCEHCGHENVQRSVLLTDKELRELEYQEVISGANTWEKVKILLRQLCKDVGYHHRYSVRLIESLQAKNKTIEETMQYIEKIQNGDMKLARLMYV